MVPRCIGPMLRLSIASVISVLIALHLLRHIDQFVIARPIPANVVAPHQFSLSADVTVLNSLNSDRRYAVFSTTSDRNNASLTYQFLLPLTTLAWQRIGFGSIVIVVGNLATWRSDPLLSFVLSSLVELEAVIVFLMPPHPNRAVTLSQVSRIFVSDILYNMTSSTDNVYVITSDADIWPISDEVYRLPPNKDILCLNAFCCGTFLHRNSTYRMLPMSNIGMKLTTWHSLTSRSGAVQSPSSARAILTYLANEFVLEGNRPALKGENSAWYRDQQLVSLLVDDWIRLRTADRLTHQQAATVRSLSDYRRQRVEFVARRISRDRIDRQRWTVRQNVVRYKVDAHLFRNAYEPRVWRRILPLVRELHGNNIQRVAWVGQYYDTFIRLLELER